MPVYTESTVVPPIPSKQVFIYILEICLHLYRSGPRMWNYSVRTSKHFAVAGYKHRDATPTGTCFSKAMKKHHTSLKHSHCQVCLFEKGINFPKGDSLFFIIKAQKVLQ